VMVSPGVNTKDPRCPPIPYAEVPQGVVNLELRMEVIRERVTFDMSDVEFQN